MTLKDLHVPICIYVVSNEIVKMLRCSLKRARKANKPDVAATMAKHPDPCIQYVMAGCNRRTCTVPAILFCVQLSLHVNYI